MGVLLNNSRLEGISYFCASLTPDVYVGSESGPAVLKAVTAASQLKSKLKLIFAK